MPCKSCAENVAAKTDLTEWVTQEEVKSLCTPCYENMVKNNISRIKKSFLMEKLNSKMKFYQITYKGREGTILNLAGTSLSVNDPMYFSLLELPLPIEELQSFSLLDVKEVDLPVKPDNSELRLNKAKIQNKKGIVWIGMSPRRVNEYGSFVKDIPNFELSDEVVNTLKDTAGFKLVG